MKSVKIICSLSLMLLLTSCDCFLGFMGPDCDVPIELQSEFDIIIRDVQTFRNSTSIPPESNTIDVYFKLNNIQGEPVPNKDEAFFEIFEKGSSEDSFKIISVNEAERTIDPNKADFRYYNTIVLDLSGSVIENNLEKLKEATVSFINNSYSNVSTGNLLTALIWFDGTEQITILQNYTSDKELLLAKVDSIDKDLPNDTSTNLNGAIIQSINFLKGQLVNSQNDFIKGGSILLFTDGSDQADYFSSEQAISAANDEKDLMDIYTVGLGNEIDQEILAQVGYSGAFFPGNIEELQSQFNTVANRIENEANSFYLMRYCSPKRNGTSQLKIGIKNKGSEGGIADFNASGFKDNCIIE